MSFVRRIKRKGHVYLAEVENKWANGQVVQRHLRCIGREADGKTLLATSLSEVEVDQVKLYGPLLVLKHLAQEIDLADTYNGKSTRPGPCWCLGAKIPTRM